MSIKTLFVLSWKEFLACLMVGVFLWLRRGSHQPYGLRVDIEGAVGGIIGGFCVAFLILFLCKLAYRAFVWVFRKIRPAT